MLETETSAYNIRNYKYVGSDASPTFKYVLSPFAQNMVDFFIPLWMAPNVITTIGLLFSFTATILTLIYNPTLEVGGPRWLHAVTGICIFAYQTLDNMDGKQARKTGSSSALGMVFDHGCDAINAGTTTLAMASVLGLGWTGKIFVTYYSSFFSFYLQTWEEYYTGAMNFAAFNGPTEGLLITATLCLYLSRVGNEVLHTPVFEIPSYILPNDNYFLLNLGLPCKSNNNFSYILLIQMFLIISVGTTMIIHLVRVFKKVTETKGSYFRAYFNLFPFALFVYLIFPYGVDSKVAFLPFYQYFTALLIAATFTEMVVHLMVGHICHYTLEPLKRLPLWNFLILYLYTFYSGDYYSIEMEKKLLVAITLFNIFWTAKFIVRIGTFFTNVLDIYVFKLGKRHSS